MKKIFIIICICISITIQPVFSRSWPIFRPPDKQLLLTLNYIDTNQCPIGQGKMISHPHINIREYLCMNFCPEDWTWFSNNDQQCHDLSDFNFKSFEISHHPDDSDTSYSEITAVYGPKGTNTVTFKFFLKTNPGEHWYCVNLNSSTTLLSCASDIRK